MRISLLILALATSVVNASYEAWLVNNDPQRQGFLPASPRVGQKAANAIQLLDFSFSVEAPIDANGNTGRPVFNGLNFTKTTDGNTATFFGNLVAGTRYTGITLMTFKGGFEDNYATPLNQYKLGGIAFTYNENSYDEENTIEKWTLAFTALVQRSWYYDAQGRGRYTQSGWDTRTQQSITQIPNTLTQPFRARRGLHEDKAAH